MNHSFKALPVGTALNYDNQFKILWGVSELPASNMRYRIVQDDGSLLEGITDQHGGTNLLESQVPKDAEIQLLGDA